MVRGGSIFAIFAATFALWASPARSQALERGMPLCTPAAVAAAKDGAQKGDAGAIYTLARYYSTGKCVAGDGTEAIRLYHRAAELGYAPAFYNLGLVFAGGAQDYKSAETAWLSGAALGHRACWLMLGFLYGMPTPGLADDIKGFAWLSLSAGRGRMSKDAHEILTQVSARLSPADRERAQALYAELKAHYGDIPEFRP